MTISTTIKRKYLDMILDYRKFKEYKGDSDYWRPRLLPLVGFHFYDDLDIVFICGRQVVRYKVLAVYHYPTPMNIDGVWYKGYFGIALGRRLS